MKKERELAFSVTLKDCEVQTFSVSGAGGQRRDKKSTGVRIIHHPSGARGECTETRSQLQNKKIAFRRMAEHYLFKYWVAVQLGRIETDEKYLERELKPEKIKVEGKVEGKWTEL